jgi:hypothetical protein
MQLVSASAPAADGDGPAARQTDLLDHAAAVLADAYGPFVFQQARAYECVCVCACVRVCVLFIDVQSSILHQR